MESTIVNADYEAVRHILTAPLIARRTSPYIDETTVDFAGLQLELATMSGGEILLVNIAYELWSAEKVTGLWELPRRLDERNFRRVLEALALMRGGSAATALTDAPGRVAA
jgi:hypothetical protein